MALSAGVRLGPYRIEAPIGAGGMGEVYRARDTRLDRTIAIKLLAADIAADPQFRERFDREARTISSLDHPHICTLFDIGHDEAAGVDYLVMQYLEGETLADRQAGGAGPEELLYASPEGKIPTGISPDGGLLLFNRGMPGMGSDVWALPLKGDRKPFPVVATPFNEGFAVFSPDGRWIAYDSTDTGPLQVYVQPFPATGARIQLSTTSGLMPSWTSDGRSVVYATADKRLMVVGVTPSGTELKPSLPRELPIPLTRTPNPRFFAMVASGERFLVPMAPVEGAGAPITVVVNWMNGLKK
jgi:Protein kinase domain/WD40-like Beta Propeller Repeat